MLDLRLLNAEINASLNTANYANKIKKESGLTSGKSSRIKATGDKN